MRVQPSLRFNIPPSWAPVRITGIYHRKLSSLSAISLTFFNSVPFTLTAANYIAVNILINQLGFRFGES